MGLEVENKSIRSSLIENGVDPDTIRAYLEEQIAMSRATDEAMKDTLTKSEFYQREMTYTKIDSFIIHLK